jgi:hypothetical protein
VLAGVLAQHRRHRLVHVGQRVVGEVDEVVVGVDAGLRLVQHPVGDGLAVAARAGASEDDRDLQLAHGFPFSGWLHLNVHVTIIYVT